MLRRESALAASVARYPARVIGLALGPIVRACGRSPVPPREALWIGIHVPPAFGWLAYPGGQSALPEGRRSLSFRITGHPRGQTALSRCRTARAA